MWKSLALGAAASIALGAAAVAQKPEEQAPVITYDPAPPDEKADAKPAYDPQAEKQIDEKAAADADAQKLAIDPKLFEAPTLRARWVPTKEAVEIDADHAVAGLFVLKFSEGSHVRLTPRGFEIDAANLVSNKEELVRLSRAGLGPDAAAAEVATINAVMAEWRAKGFEAEYIFRTPGFRNGVDDKFVDDQFVEKAELEQRSGEELADLDLYYAIHSKDFRDIDAQRDLMNKLNSFAVVEQVYPAVFAEGAQAGPTPNIASQQGYLGPAPMGLDVRPVWARAGGRGDGVRLTDVEFDWVTDHEDFAPARNRFWGGRPACAYDGNGSEHGTASMGVIAAPHNGFGVDGIAPNVRYGLSSTCRPAHWIFGFLFALFTGDEVTGRTHNVAVAAAIGEASFNFWGTPELRPGDVLLIEQHAPGPGPLGTCPCNCDQWGYVAMEHYQESFDAIRRATAAGIIVVEAAGNGGQDLDAPRYRARFSTSVRHSGALLVGASNDGDRVPACFSNSARRVDVHAWGDYVVTTGYGDGSVSPFTRDRPINRYYAPRFGGTSSASAIVAGAVASLQGARRASDHPPLSPIEVTRLLVATGTPQAGSAAEIAARQIGPQPNLRAAVDRAVMPGGGFTGAGTYVIRSKFSGKVLDIDIAWFRGQDDGQRLVQHDPHGGNNQIFNALPDGRGAFYLQAMHSWKPIDISGLSLADGANVAQWRWNGGANQRFRIEPAGGAYYRIISVHSGKALEVFAFRRENGARITQWTWHGGDNQLWEFMPTRR